MSENEDKTDIDELLSCYLDGELSKRQHVEVQRLIEHDADVAGRLAQMRKQKLLLMSLPVETAPSTIFEDINRALERKLILDNYEEQAQESRGRRSLYYMRAATAAIVLALLGVLTVIVVNIVSPVSGPKTYVQNDRPGKVETVEKPGVLPAGAGSVVLADGDIFNADLLLRTDESVAMINFVRKAIYNADLLDEMTVDKQALQTVYTVSADPERVGILIAELQGAWQNCIEPSLSIAADDSKLVIENVTPGQVRSVLVQSRNDKRIQLARAYYDLNQSGKTDDDVLLALQQELANAPTISSPVKPGYTSNERNAIADPGEGTSAAEQVVFVITIKSL